MKTKIPTLALGFLLGVASMLLIGQRQPPDSTGRFSMVFTAAGVCVQDTATGTVRLIPGPHLKGIEASDPEAYRGTKMNLGEPFEPGTR